MQDERTQSRVQARFWMKVKQQQREDGCWVWSGTIAESSDSLYYGQFWLNGKNASAHRLAYTWIVGPIPEGLTLDHLCRNSLCVNPRHLEPVTDTVNILRGDGPAAKNARKTHCANGHEYSTANTRIRTDDRSRSCRACDRARMMRYRAAKRAAAEAAAES